MEIDSPPSSPTASPAHSPIQPPTPTTDSTLISHHIDTTPTSTSSTPLTSSSPASGESLTDFDFSQEHYSRYETSDESPDSRRVVYESSESYRPHGLSYQLKETDSNTVSSRPRVGFHSTGETHLELPDQDALMDDIRIEGGFSTPPTNKIGDAVVLEFPPSEEVVSESVSSAVEPTGACHGVTVPLELAARHEMSGRESLLTHAASAPSLPSRVERETTRGSHSGNFTPHDHHHSSFVNFVGESVEKGNSRESPQWKQVAKETAVALSESEEGQVEFTNITSAFAFREQSVARPPFKRYKQLVDYDDDNDDPSSKQPAPLIPVSPEVDTINQDTASPSVRSKRYRKRGVGLSLSLDLEEEETNSDISRGQPRGHPQLRPQYSFDERPTQRPSHVVLSLDDGNETFQVDSWDHGDLEDDALEEMKIEKDRWRGRDISRCHKPRSNRVESERHDNNKGVSSPVRNIIEEKEDADRNCVKRSGESDMASSHDTNSNIKKSLKVKSVLCQVKEEVNEVIEDEVHKSPKEKGLKDFGHENQAYLDDEQDAVSQEENGADQSSMDSPVEVARRRSNPEVSVPKSEEIVRSHSYGNELNKVMNNLNGDQEEQTLAAPSLRKRSTSRGRPENQEEGKENSNAEESPPSTSKKESHFVSFGPTFSYGDGDSATSSIFHKLVANPIMKLTRSESTKSHVGGKPGREEMFSRSVSNIWEGGVRTKGSGSSHHGRPPQVPSSLSRDDHRHHSHKNHLLQQHLYRNSRRNMQAKLLRQLSDVYYEDPRYNNGDPHHTGRHDYSHKKHDGHHPDHHHHHHSGRHNTIHHDIPPTPTDHRNHPHGGHGHHHRSQSQRQFHRPKHEPLRRLNTYGHEEYHKYVQGHEHRYEQAQEHFQSHPGQGGEGQGGDGALKPPEGEEAVRRISHYRQEEKGKTDVERWVGVHGDQPTEGTPSQPLLPSPGTPHIVVSPEDSSRETQPLQGDNETNLNTPGSNGPVFSNAQSTPASPPTPGNNAEDKRARPDKLSMTTLDLPDGRGDNGFYKKTRRNSINEMHRRFGSQTNLQRSNSVNNIQRSNSRISLAPSVLDWKQEGNDALIACLSALYGKLLVVMGMAFPTAEVISHDIPITFYNGFYLYLYIGSIIFLVYAYLFLLHVINIPTESLKSKIHSIRNLMTIPDLSLVLPHRNTSKQEGNLAGKDSRVTGCSDLDKESDRASINTGSYKTPKYTLTESNNHGSMYLKMGAVLFGIGSMIYSGLEVGQYFELKSDENCADILLAIAPAARMLFTFIQMYFIFLNSRVAISRHRVIARFGLMHMIGTNLCIWLNVLVQETKHEIINLTLGPGGHHGVGAHHGVGGTGHHSDSDAVLGHHADGVNDTIANNHTHGALLNDTQEHNTHGQPNIHQIANDTHNIVKRGANHQALSIYECRRSDLMGELVDKASPFLFPCTIEYSLLCAGVIYVIWKNINKPEVAYDGDSDISTYIARKARHHYSVDCAHANRGLFMGILVLVLTIISLILFFVLINNEAYKEVAILEANIIELSVYGVASVTVIIGMIQMRELEFIPEGDIELDNILLLIAQSGVYIYTSFTVIGGHFTMTDNLILPLLSAIITLLQTTLQTIFILDASRRCCYNQDQLQRKPGREMVTFLLVCNLAMWAINTFETSRADAHPTQLTFYGIWAWTIISHISMPLAIFYRFHVTVCLCEIWKRSYKLRNDY